MKPLAKSKNPRLERSPFEISVYPLLLVTIA